LFLIFIVVERHTHTFSKDSKMDDRDNPLAGFDEIEDDDTSLEVVDLGDEDVSDDELYGLDEYNEYMDYEESPYDGTYSEM
jgi:hypothetical protein